DPPASALQVAGMTEPGLPWASFSIFLFCFFETGSHYIAQAGLRLMAILPHPPSAGITGMSHH
ncbi:hypothetical protein GW7_16050, partial [Heterocephalus glaber]